MSAGATGALHFPHSKNTGAPGIFYKRDQPGNDQRKFGYKSRKLRHPLRQTDEQEALIQMEIAKNEEKKKFNKTNKDFVRQNKQRFVPKDQAEHPPAGGTQIKPGTVTLTQEQLAALLASLGKTAKDNPLKISIDASNNRIEVENYESEEEAELHKNKCRSQAPERNDKQSHTKPIQDNTEHPSQSHFSLEEEKQETGVPDVVTWKHLTVGERKRLQWARERGGPTGVQSLLTDSTEAPADYDPWGRPGAGAPMQRKEDESKPHNHSESGWSGNQVHTMAKTYVPADRTEKQDLIVKEIEKLQREIREAEQKTLEEEIRSLKGNKHGERGQPSMNKQEKHKTSRERRNKSDVEVQMAEENKQGYNDQGNMGLDSTTTLNKKEIERKNWLADLDKQRQEQRLRKQQEKARDHEGVQDQFADRFGNHKTVEHISPKHEQSMIHFTNHSTKDVSSALGKSTENVTETKIPPAAMRSAMVPGDGTLNEARYDNARSEEKRRWLEQLDQQREEQRLAKLAQKEKDKQDSGILADRYPVDHQKLRQTNEILQSQSISPRESNPVNTQRTSSAPLATLQDPDQSNVTPPSFLRGQGAFIDPVTRKEQEEKRRIQMEYQAQVKAQIDEKDRIKREDRERKMRDDMEEERKLQMERDSLNRQLETEQGKIRAREELRQKQLDVLKSAMDEAQGKALEDKNVKRIHHLQQRGHDISQLRAAYEASLPQGKEYDVPTAGRAMESSRERQPYFVAPALYSTYNIDTDMIRNERDPLEEVGNARQYYAKEPYVEDRILTPSTYRNPSKQHDNPNSPRREFGTQTLELKDLQAILRSLPDDIQIEYKMKVEEALQEKEKQKQAPTRKVHPKYTQENRDHNKSMKEIQPPENMERPLWNQRKRKTVTKQSEKDPFYSQKRKEAEVRRERRERQLLYLQELNKEKIPSHTKSPGKPHCESPEDVKQAEGRSRKVAPPSKSHGAKPSTVNNRDASPNILSLLDDREKKPMSKSHQNTGRSSPPIPAVRHRATGRYESDKDPYQYANSYLQLNQTDSRYGDTTVMSTGDEFVPFMRTTEILDPSKAEEPVVVSRENSRAERARNAYYGTHHPGNKGRKLDVYSDRDRESTIKDSQNPLFHPGLVSDHPTARQEMILQQLSSLKQNLKQRQRELEDYMSPSEIQEGAVRS